ncbi:vitamin K epoxide reductase family protein [Hymenobacter sp. CRA2]|uniref:vitamin K epoxide reductase family protein n=1 Tax=Hymenobacter sp. CRA2 TaxID=1955620 RepID=UPI00098F603B|nr:vitamin K epoxide reductase family protein [Hymenobacter sp. CRA2]OON66019.1 hypothetical protein B0919_22520 [Hymenobacter sp. CRA2]
MEQVVARFLQLQRLPVARHEFIDLVRSHPDYPSLLSVSDVLDSLGVNSLAAQFADEDLPDVAFPYLAHVERNGGDLLLIRNAAELAAARREDAGWSGILLQIDGMRVAPDKEQRERYETERKLLLVTRLTVGLTALLLLQPVLHYAGWLGAGFYLTALAGGFISYLLFASDLDFAQELVAEFCGGGPQAGCDDVLHTDPVNVLGFFKLSDASATYFLWQAAVLTSLALAPDLRPGVYPLLGIAAVLGLPVVALSVYYQYAVAKAWCRLCLGVDAVLLVQAGLAVYAFAAGQFTLGTLAPVAVLNAALALLAIAGLVVLLKQYGQRHNDLLKRKQQLQQGKNAIELFTAALQQQPRADTREFAQEMVIGNPEAPVEIIMVSNPFCAPCKHMHARLDHLLQLYPEQLKLRMRWVISGADSGKFPTSTQYLLQHWLTHVWGTPDQSQRTSDMIHAWYAVMNPERFGATHPADFSGDHALSTQLVTQHNLWSRQQHIKRTPTLFINGYQFPPGYKPTDLQLLIPSLADYFSAEVATDELLQPA